MPRTLVEKVIAAHAGRDVRAGELVVAEVDFVYAHDWSGPLSIKQFRAMGFKGLKRPAEVAFFFDHSSPGSTREFATDQAGIRAFVKEQGCRLYEVGEGVCHQVVAESIARPGQLLLGADSHTCMAGALGAFATGMGATDIATAMGLGKTWLRVPATVRFEFSGKLEPGVSTKDVILHVIGRVGADGMNYRCMEFAGEGAAGWEMHERFVVANMVVEAGGKCGFFASDDRTRRYLESRGRGADHRALAADPGADYEDVIEIDLGRLEPQLAAPHSVDNVRPISHGDCQGVPVQQVYVGSCTNGRLEDIAEVARVLRGRHVAEGTRLVVTPSSKEVWLAAMRAGHFETILGAGGVVNSPGCGACPGSHIGILGDGEVCVSSTNRNFKGRMGNPKSSVWLASPATCAASAVEGRLTDPRRYLEDGA